MAREQTEDLVDELTRLPGEVKALRAEFAYGA